VNQSGSGPITRWLDMSYKMGRNELSKRDTIKFYIEAYGGWVEVDKEHLPEGVSWEWFGAGGPQENQAKMQNRMQALQLALKMDQLNMQIGGKPVVNVAAAIRETLREGGWNDLEAVTNAAQAAGGPPAAPGVSGPSGGPPAAVAALQNLTGAGG
jgi:hypothetical protein